MSENNLRGLEFPARTDESLTNQPALSALERDLLIATANLEQTDTLTTVQHLKQTLESSYTEITHADLHNSLGTLTTTNLLEETSTHHYQPTTNGTDLLETYTNHLQQILQPNHITLTLERPITPGDAERAYCELLTKCQEVPQ
ncbi:hypothetical protein EL22_11910 [Halostagnicola sp. A56]|uniref:hypothetical protein n=1 Tax=Halostagnicola sp. A56 TaxID=1495067 RepID=UPI0004A12FA2|nr:hypothetical protein [Halostagnicola sp. A56]KDE57477.1 hypothetical protein EL22_11910 [Halostagnicola sp. A56]